MTRLTRWSHSCVRLEVDGRVLVIDPGCWSERVALDGCDAVLVTHEHADHLDPAHLDGLDVPVFGPAGVAAHEVVADEEFSAAGVRVVARGGRHAAVHDGQPSCANLGYVVAGVYHPGDALHVPPDPVDLLLVPMQASWLKTAEALDFVAAVAPRIAIGIHDGQVNERGLGALNGWLSRAGVDYRWLAPGTTLEL